MPVEQATELQGFCVEYRSTTRMTSQNLPLDQRRWCAASAMAGCVV